MRGTHRVITACVLFFSAVLFSTTSLAAVIVTTNPGDLNSENLIDFESMTTGPLVAPLSMGNLTIAADELGIASVISFGANGTEVAGNTLQPLANGTFNTGAYGTMTFLFSQAVSEFGLGLFDLNRVGNVLTAYDQFDVEIVSVAITDLGPSGGSEATFLGLLSDSPDIAKVIFSPIDANEVYSVDNVVFSAVPLSSADVLFSIGLISLTIASRRRILPVT